MRNKVLDIIKQAGLPLCGISPMPDEFFNCRAKSRLPKNSKSVIVCLFPYYSSQLGSGNISKYAMVEDYHLVAGEILELICQLLREHFDYSFCWFVDNSPIPEVQSAVSAGLGFTGRHGLLITRQYGTYQFIGEIVTDLELEPDSPCTDTCLDCGKCEIYCPGNAISGKKHILSNCASYINQLKRELTEDEALIVKKCASLWGCDICQEVCPHNLKIQQTPIKRFKENIICSVSPENIDELVKTRAFGFRGSGPLLRNYGIINSESGNNKVKE